VLFAVTTRCCWPREHKPKRQSRWLARTRPASSRSAPETNRSGARVHQLDTGPARRRERRLNRVLAGAVNADIVSGGGAIGGAKAQAKLTQDTYDESVECVPRPKGMGAGAGWAQQKSRCAPGERANAQVAAAPGGSWIECCPRNSDEIKGARSRVARPRLSRMRHRRNTS